MDGIKAGHIHLEEKVHGILQVALLERNADGDLGVAVEGSTLGVPNGSGISGFVNNKFSSWCGHSRGREDKHIQLHNESC